MSSDTPAHQSGLLEDEVLDGALASLLAEHHVAAETMREGTVRLLAVPMADGFNKSRSNLLVNRQQNGKGWSLFVDADLAYRGQQPGLAAILGGPAHKGWQKLRLPPQHGTLNTVVVRGLQLLDSPLASSTSAEKAGKSSPAADEAGPLLAAAGEMISPRVVEAAGDRTIRRDLAIRAAKVLIRTEPPSVPLLWGSPGIGLDQLALAAAGGLRGRGFVKRIMRVSSARVAAGYASAQIDAALSQMLAEAASLTDTLLVLTDFELLISRSSVGRALLCGALKGGSKILATARSEETLELLKLDERLRRRLVLIRVKEPDAMELDAIARHLAANSQVRVEPEAVSTAVKLALEQKSGRAAAVAGILAAGIAESRFHGSGSVAPDDILAGWQDNWENE